MYYVKVESTDGFHLVGKSGDQEEARAILRGFVGPRYDEEYDKDHVITMYGDRAYITQHSPAIEKAYREWNFLEWYQALEWDCKGCIKPPEYHYVEQPDGSYLDTPCWEVCEYLEEDGKCALERFYKGKKFGILGLFE